MIPVSWERQQPIWGWFSVCPSSFPKNLCHILSLYMSLMLACGTISGLWNVPQVVPRSCLRAQRAVDSLIRENKATGGRAHINWIKYLDCTQANEKAHLPLEAV